jgi:hypothetical protein
MPTTPPVTVPSPTPSLDPTTTAQQDLTTAGQRQINLIWERTQALLALSVVMFTVFIDGLVTVLCIIMKTDLTASMMMGLSFLNITCTGVISFYFSRTNHAAIGGVGQKPMENYTGR